MVSCVSDASRANGLVPAGQGTILPTECFSEWRAWLTEWRDALMVARAVGGGAAVNGRVEKSGGTLVSGLGGEPRYDRWKGGDLAYTVAGERKPLLLVHGT